MLHLANETGKRIDYLPLLEAAERLLQAEDCEDASVNFLLSDDEEIRRLNRIYRNQDKPTDVLSFAQMLEDEERPFPELDEEETHLGDIAISVDTARRQAEEHGVSLELELSLLAVHGILHLLGYEDETYEGTAEMRKREREILDFSYPEHSFPK